MHHEKLKPNVRQSIEVAESNKDNHKPENVLGPSKLSEVRNENLKPNSTITN